MRRTVRIGMPSIRPRSNSEISPWLTPTRSPKSRWRHPSRWRRARPMRPILRSSTGSVSTPTLTRSLSAASAWRTVARPGYESGTSRDGRHQGAIVISARARSGSLPRDECCSCTAWFGGRRECGRQFRPQHRACGPPGVTPDRGRCRIGRQGFVRGTRAPFAAGRAHLSWELAQYAASFRIPSAIFSGLTMNQSSRTWLYGTPGTSGPAIRVTGPSR